MTKRTERALDRTSVYWVRAWVTLWVAHNRHRLWVQRAMNLLCGADYQNLGSVALAYYKALIERGYKEVK